jgi:hypothetical protein
MSREPRSHNFAEGVARHRRVHAAASSLRGRRRWGGAPSSRTAGFSSKGLPPRQYEGDPLGPEREGLFGRPKRPASPLRGRRRCAATFSPALRACESNPVGLSSSRPLRQLKRDPSGSLFNWRRGRDSNPRWAINPYTLSRRAPSTARTPLPEETGGDPNPAAPRHPSPLLPLLPSGPDGVHSLSLRGDRIGSPLKGGYRTGLASGWVARLARDSRTGMRVRARPEVPCA